MQLAPLLLLQILCLCAQLSYLSADTLPPYVLALARYRPALHWHSAVSSVLAPATLALVWALNGIVQKLSKSFPGLLAALTEALCWINCYIYICGRYMRLRGL